jgi:hypothetical protein
MPLRSIHSRLPAKGSARPRVSFTRASKTSPPVHVDRAAQIRSSKMHEAIPLRSNAAYTLPAQRPRAVCAVGFLAAGVSPARLASNSAGADPGEPGDGPADSLCESPAGSHLPHQRPWEGSGGLLPHDSCNMRQDFIF